MVDVEIAGSGKSGLANAAPQEWGRRQVAIQFISEKTKSMRVISKIVFAGQTAVDGQHRVPMVRRGDHEHVHRFIVEQGAVIVDQFGHAAGLLLHFRAALPADRLPHIADVSDFTVRFSGKAVHD